MNFKVILKKIVMNKKKLIKIASVAGLLTGLFLIIYPFTPEIVYFFSKKNDSVEVPYVTILSEENDDESLTFESEGAPIPLVNTLVIPKIGVDVEIVEGNNENALLKGAWHRPETGNPFDGGNFVVTGHRFRYLPPNNTTFYNLDKLEVGDVIIVYYESKEYDYKISEVLVVNPEDLYVEEDLGYDAITLYTCTPLWTSTQRLVVRALPYN
jgi:sortase A